jgi:hypothetical protein
MTTANEIITDALVLAGVTGQGRTPSAADLALGLRFLNRMLDQWSTNRWTVYALQDQAIVCNGSMSYKVGPNGDFNVAVRPDRIESAYIRQYGTGQVNNPNSQLGSTYASGAGLPTTADILPGTCQNWLNTDTGVISCWCNYAGTMVELAAQPDLQP